jgi:hypothetical protein
VNRTENVPAPAAEDSSTLFPARTIQILVVVVAVFLLLCIGMAFTRLPDADEAHRASEAYTLVHHGHMGLSLVDPTGTWMTGVNRLSYWVMPLYSFLLAGLFRVGGESLWCMRLWGIALGMVALIAYAVFFGVVFRRPATTLLFAALLGINYDFINFTTVARADMLCLAFGALGLATYASMRQRSLAGALCLGNLCGAAACMTHPYGGLYVVALAGLALTWDRSRISWRLWLLAALPYGVALFLWSLYIAQAPDLFVAQFFGNIRAGRLPNQHSILHAITSEFSERYFGYFSGLGGRLPRVMSLKILITLSYLGSVAYVLTFGRRRPGAKTTAALAVGFGLALMFLENLKWYIYLLHILPLFAATLALTVSDLRERFPHWRVWLYGAVAGMLVFNAGVVISRIRLNEYRTTFEPVAHYVLEARHPGDLVRGDGGFAFHLGFDGALIDDFRLGYYSRRKARIIIMNGRYQEWLNIMKSDDREVYFYMRALLQSSCAPRFTRGQYTVYVCNAVHPD